MEFMTREVFDTLIIIAIMLGLALATVRLYKDFTRPLPGDPDYRPRWADDDTQPVHPKQSADNDG